MARRIERTTSAFLVLSLSKGEGRSKTAVSAILILRQAQDEEAISAYNGLYDAPLTWIVWALM